MTERRTSQTGENRDLPTVALVLSAAVLAVLWLFLWIWGPVGDPQKLLLIAPIIVVLLAAAVLRQHRLLVSRLLEQQEALRAQETRFKDFAATASDWYWEMDADLRFSYFSERFEEISGVAPEKLLGKTRAETGIPDVDPQAWEQHLQDLAAGRPFRDFVHPRSKANGETVWLSISGQPQINAQGVFQGYRGTGRDITRQVHDREMLARAKTEADRSSLAKSAFLANMSHELRTPLTAIIGFSEITLSQALGPVGNPHYVNCARDIKAAGDHLLDLINDVLDLSKVEAGKAELQEELVDLTEVVRSSLKIIAPRAADAEVTVTPCLPSGEVALKGDERKLKQMVLNLVTNAVKFTPAGGCVEVALTSDGNGDLLLQVQDSGVGISPEDIERVLEPFTQAQNLMETNTPGTGLGLALTKSFAELHGGELTLISTAGQGTTASLRLPGWRAGDPARIAV